MRKVYFLVVLLVCSCQMSRSYKEKVEIKSDLHFDVKEKVLPNGLKILVVENHKLPIYSYHTYYQVGSKFETKGITGASHFLEHMMFKGAKKYGEGEFDRLVEGNGGTNNAYTSKDLTVYHQDLPSDTFEVMADIEADRMQNLLLGDDSFEKERQVVIEERKRTLENSDSGRLYDYLSRKMYAKTPYGHSVLGSMKDIKSVSTQEIRDYFKKYYAPNNAVVVVVGGLKADYVFKVLEKKFGKIPPSTELDNFKKPFLGDDKYKFRGKYSTLYKIKGNAPTPKFLIGIQGVKIGSKDAHILDVVVSILTAGESSFLSKNYVLSSKPRLTYVYGESINLMNSGMIAFGGQLLPKKSIHHFRNHFFKTLRKSCNTAMTERSLSKIKNVLLYATLSSFEHNTSIAGFIGDMEVEYGDYRKYKNLLAKYNSITVDQLKSTCKKYLRKDKSIYVSLWNKH